LIKIGLFFALSVQDDYCELCHTGLEIAHQAIAAGYTDDQIKAAIAAACPTLPSQYQDICNQGLQNIDDILAMIHNGSSDDEICKKYGLCNVIKAKKAARASNGIGCDFCVGIVNMIEEFLAKQSTEEEIIALVDKLCDLTVEPIKSICDTIVADYIPQIITWINQGITNLKICNKLGFCEDVNASLRRANGISCTMCQTIVAQVEKIMVDTKVESEIIALVEKLCDKFPSPYSTLCNSLVEQYVPVIMQWLEQGLEHLEICQKLGFCTNNSVIRNVNGISCTMCQTIVAQVEKIMVDTKVESEIIALIEKLCEKFPSPYSTLCNSLVEQYVPVIMEWLEQGLEHIEICQKLGFCTTEQVLLARKPLSEANGVTCDVCKQFIQWAEEKLEDITVPALWKLVSVECPKVPYLKYVCALITEDNIKTLVDLLVSKATPEKACTFIKICP